MRKISISNKEKTVHDEILEAQVGELSGDRILEQEQDHPEKNKRIKPNFQQKIKRTGK